MFVDYQKAAGGDTLSSEREGWKNLEFCVAGNWNLVLWISLRVIYWNLGGIGESKGKNLFGRPN